MDIEDSYQSTKTNKKLRLKIITNRGLQFITAVRPEATVSDLANRVLSVYLELAGDGLAPSTRKQLTVSAVKQGVFFMPKSQCVSSLLSHDDQVEVIIVKARPKYPQQLYQIPLSRSQPETHIKHSVPPLPNSGPALPHSGPPLPHIQEDEEPQVLEKGLSEVKLIAEGREESRRQKKKDKKKKNNKKKHEQAGKEMKTIRQEYLKDDRVEEVKVEESKQSRIREREQKDMILESMPSKKVKIDQQQIDLSKPNDKPHFKIGQSPKITFHHDPKTDSPKIDFCLEPPRKKSTDNSLFKADRKVEGKSKTINEQLVSPPLQILKSPLSSNRTPQPATVLNQAQKGKEKEELSNFSLPRKSSEDRRGELRNRKHPQESIGSVINKNEIKEVIGNSIGMKGGAQNKNGKVEVQKQGKKQGEGQVKKEVEKLKEKQTRSLVVVQPGSESDSQGDQKLAHQPYVSARAKELAEIKSKIQSFSLDSDNED